MQSVMWNKKLYVIVKINDQNSHIKVLACRSSRLMLAHFFILLVKSQAIKMILIKKAVLDFYLSIIFNSHKKYTPTFK